MPIERKPYVSLNAEKRLEIEQLFKNGYGMEETAAKGRYILYITV